MSLRIHAPIHIVFLSAALGLSACGGSSNEAQPNEKPVTAQRSIEVKLDEVGLDASALDKSVNPCDDFFEFACGGWIKTTEIPADKPNWVRSFSEIHERSERDLREILEDAQKDPGEDPVRAKLGKFYGACVDEAAVEKAGLTPIKPLLELIKGVKDPKTLSDVVAVLHKQGVMPLFNMGSAQDAKNATQVLFQIDQGGLGLPDRDYYLADDADKKKIRGEYQKHVERMLLLTGMKPADAKKGAVEVLKIETELAKVSKTKVERRDPVKMYNKIDRAGVEKAAPAFVWSVYFEGIGLKDAKDIDVTAPAFLEGMSPLFKSIKPESWRVYLSWNLVRSLAPALTKAFVDESFTMQKALTGQAENEARWKRCVAATDRYLGELLAQPFVEKRFAGESKTAAEKYVAEISLAFGRNLEGLKWMEAGTKEKAKHKLSTFANLVGYPAKWKEYDYEVGDAFAGNVLKGRYFLHQFDIAKVGKPVDRGEWEMTPPTVNAYYNPLRNQMVFPAGILQPPFYDVKAAVPVNLGAMGMVVGHEMTHGFDDEGSQFDADGNLNNWWEPSVRSAFDERTDCVVRQYSNYEPVAGSKINGKLTLGENIADLGGLKMAFSAYRAMRAGAPELKVAEGFTEDQQFFLANAQIWCAKSRDEYLKLMVQNNPHSAPRFRVNGPMSNLREFSDAFSCPEGSNMRRKETCEVW